MEIKSLSYDQASMFKFLTSWRKVFLLSLQFKYNVFWNIYHPLFSIKGLGIKSLSFKHVLWNLCVKCTESHGLEETKRHRKTFCYLNASISKSKSISRNHSPWRWASEWRQNKLFFPSPLSFFIHFPPLPH